MSGRWDHIGAKVAPLANQRERLREERDDMRATMPLLPAAWQDMAAREVERAERAYNAATTGHVRPALSTSAILSD